MVDLVTVAIFVAIASLVWLAARMLLRPRPVPGYPPLSEILPTRTRLEGTEPGNEALVEGLAAQLPQTPFGGEDLDKDLRRAGSYRPHARSRFLALRNGLVILAVVATGAMAVLIGPDHQQAVLWGLGIGLVATVMCWSLPRVVLAMQAARRVQRIRTGLPDALDTISMCLRGGISLQECLAHVGREMMSVHPDLGVELLIVNQQSEINSFPFAMQQFAARIDAPEVVALAALVIQSQRLGTGVVEAVCEFADNLRLKRRQLAEAKAGRAELFLLFPVVLCLVPSVLLILWGPSLLEIWNFLQGMETPIRTGL